MKKLFTSLLSLALVATISSCGEKEEEVQEKNIFGAFKEFAEGMEDIAEEMEGNDSNDGEFNMGGVIDHKELKAFLPTDVSGYETGETSSSSVKMQGMSIGAAKVEFTNGDEKITVIITDYFAAASMFKMASLVWKMGMEIDTPEEYAKSYDFDGKYSGWLSYEKNSNDASAACGINNRIILTIEATNQSDFERVKDIVESMDLEGISELGQSEDVASN